MSAGRDVMPFSKRTYEKCLLLAKSGHSAVVQLTGAGQLEDTSTPGWLLF